ncbi:hypothetical protein QJQ45_001056 [Haematococcus lacustris]|nr:hypothetical protein QJQ45_001056 [Haematococcus lacustris]
MSASSSDSGINCPTLDKDNFRIWDIRIRAALQDAQVFSVVQQGIATAPPPLANNATAAQQAAHDAQLARVEADTAADLKAKNLILRYVGNQHARAVDAAPTAQQAYDQIHAEFVQISIARQLQLQSQLSQLRMQASETVAVFFSWTFQLQDELAAAGSPVTDSALLLAILNAMPPEFSIPIQILKVQLSLGNANLDDVKKILLQSEAEMQAEQLQQPNPTLWSSSFTYSRGRGPHSGSRGRGFSPPGCRGGYSSGRGGAFSAPSRSGAPQQQGDRSLSSNHPANVCQYCNRVGHTLSTCNSYARDHRGFVRPASPGSMARWSPNQARGNSPSSRRGGAGGRPAASSSAAAAPDQANTLFMVRSPMFPRLSRTEPVATPLPFEQHPEQMTDEEHLDYYSRQPRWVIDSGASSHVMPWRSCLSDYVPFNPPIQLQLGGSGSSISVLGRGTTYLTNSAGEQWAVSGVLHALDAAYCYLSVSQLTHAGVRVNFQGDSCELIGPGNPPEWHMQVRKAAPGLYWWYINAVAQGNCIVGPGADHEYESDGHDPEAHGSHCQELDPQVWHQRCGHASFSVLTRMQREGMVEGVNVSRAQFAEAACSSAVCPGCAMGKQHRRVVFDLPTNTPPVTAALGLVHMDVCGPMPHTGRDNSRYIATFLDDYTGLSVIQLLQSKDQVPAAIQRVITELKTQSGQRCKALRSDNGSEYCNKTVQDWCSSKGIQQQLSAPYCPEQNGKAERLNRTIMQSTRSMLLTSGLPPGFWVDAARKANYVRNLLPITGQSLTPWEAFYHRKPNLSALRVFGATA